MSTNEQCLSWSTFSGHSKVEPSSWWIRNPVCHFAWQQSSAPNPEPIYSSLLSWKGMLNGIVTNPYCPAERFRAVTRLHANSTHRKLHAVVPLRMRFMGDRKPYRCLNKTIRCQLAKSSMHPCTDYTEKADVVNHLLLRRKNMLLTVETGWFRDYDSHLFLYEWSTWSFALKQKLNVVK